MYQYFVPLTFQDFFLVAVDHFHFSFFWPLSWLEFVGFVLDTSSTVTSSVILEGKELGFVLFSFFVFYFKKLTFPVCSYWLSMVEGNVSLIEEPSFKGFLLLFSCIECHLKILLLRFSMKKFLFIVKCIVSCF